MVKVLLKTFLVSLLFFVSNYTKADFKVIGYFPNWTSTNPATLQFDKLTHINYAFVTPNTNGTIKGMATVSDSTKLRNLITYAHANNVKVLISIGGAGGSGGFVTVGGSSTLRTTFTKNVLALIKAFNLDGADIDWEFPNNSTDASNCSLLMKELSDSLHKYNKLSTMAVNPYGTYANYILSDIFDYVDFMNVMAYDGGTPHSTMGMATTAISYWADTRGLARDKIILGVPFYGRNTSGVVPYKSLVAADPLAPYMDQTTYNSKQTNYNGIVTIKNKTKLALDNAGGIMIWDLTNDTNDETSLLSAIHSQIPLTAIYDQIIESDLTLFPNPATSYVQILFNKNAYNSFNRVIISDPSGKKMMELENSDESINISNLEEGFYIISIVKDGKIGQKKLIISRR